MPPKRSASTPEESELRERATLMLEAFERDERHAGLAQLRQVLDGARGAATLRAILHEFRGMRAGLTSDARAELDRALTERFGPDPEHERDRAVVARVRERGRIRSEQEYRIVQGYADAIAADVDAQGEFLALGALLDAYMAAP